MANLDIVDATERNGSSRGFGFARHPSPEVSNEAPFALAQMIMLDCRTGTAAWPRAMTDAKSYSSTVPSPWPQELDPGVPGTATLFVSVAHISAFSFGSVKVII